MSCNGNYALGQYAELCLNTGVLREDATVDHRTVNPYVAGSSPARGASFIGFFQQSFHALFLNVANFGSLAIA